MVFDHSTLCREVWELRTSSPFLLPEKLKRSGPRQRGNLWALLPSQALCLDRASIPATVHLPFPQLHTWHMGNSFQAQPACSGLQEGQSPMARAWMWARAATQLLVGAASTHIPMGTDVMKNVVAGSSTLLNHFEIVCVPHFWKPKPMCGCTEGKIPLECFFPNTAQGTLTGKVPFAMGCRQARLPKLGRC